MSKPTPGFPLSRPIQPGRRWGIRAVVLVFFYVLLLWSNLFAGWTATPAHAATRPTSNPVLKTPSWLQPPAVTPHVLASPGNGSQTITTGPIPRPTLNVVPPQSVVLTTAAQQVVSGNGTFELDSAAGSVSAAQIQAAGGAIRLTVNQLDPGSGGDASGRVFWEPIRSNSPMRQASRSRRWCWPIPSRCATMPLQPCRAGSGRIRR